MVHVVYIIKPEKFWEKHKTNMGSSKYTFEVGSDASAYIAVSITCLYADLSDNVTSF